MLTLLATGYANTRVIPLIKSLSPFGNFRSPFEAFKLTIVVKTMQQNYNFKLQVSPENYFYMANSA